MGASCTKSRGEILLHAVMRGTAARIIREGAWEGCKRSVVSIRVVEPLCLESHSIIHSAVRGLRAMSDMMYERGGKFCVPLLLPYHISMAGHAVCQYEV